MAEPVYTLIIAAYNAESTIADAILSLQNQRDSEWRLIVVDDGSTDSTFETTQSFAALDSRIMVLSQENAGTGAARNAALPFVRTPYCGYLDADDVLADHYSAAMHNLMAEYPGYDIYSSDGVHVFEDQRTQLVFNYGRVVSVTLDEMIDECWILGGGALIRTEALRSLGGYREHLYGEDYDLWMRAISAGLTHVGSPEPLYVYHQSVQGQKSEDRQAGNLSAVQALRDLIESGVLDRKHVRQAKKRIESRLAYPALAEAQRRREEEARAKTKCDSSEDSSGKTPDPETLLLSKAESRRVAEERATIAVQQLVPEGRLGELLYTVLRAFYRLGRTIFRRMRAIGRRFAILIRAARTSGWRLRTLLAAVRNWSTVRHTFPVPAAEAPSKSVAPSALRPALSVVVPAFNAAITIRETLDAIAAQSYRGWECIVVDDGSQDETAQIVDEYVRADSRFRLIQQENTGSAGAYNTGVNAAESTLIAICSADDILLQDHLSAMMGLVGRNPHHGIFSSNGAYLYDETKRTKDVYDGPPWDEELSLSLKTVLAACFFSVGAIYRRSVFDLIGGYREHVYGEDYDFWLRAMAVGVQHKYLPEVLSYHRISATQKSADVVRVYESNLEVYRHLIDGGWATGGDVALVEAAIVARRELLESIRPAVSQGQASVDG